MPKYTRRQYLDIGDTLRRTKATKKIIDEWVRKFKYDNPRFDEQRFRDYVKGKRKS